MIWEGIIRCGMQYAVCGLRSAVVRRTACGAVSTAVCCLLSAEQLEAVTTLSEVDLVRGAVQAFVPPPPLLASCARGNACAVVEKGTSVL
jgi:hypothetical protein